MLYHKIKSHYNFDNLKIFCEKKINNLVLDFFLREKFLETAKNYIEEEKITSCVEYSIFIEIQEIEAKTKEIPLLDMVCCLPAEAPYISAVLQKYPNIKWVHSLFAGVDKFLQIEKVKNDSSIILTNARGAYSDALAEYTILALLYFNYNIPTYLTSFTKREWQRPLNELVDKKTITIIGYGKNGIGIAKSNFLHWLY